MTKYLLKSKIALIYLVAAVFGIGTTALATSTVTPIGGSAMDADLAVANVTAGNTTYSPSVNAKAGDVVKFEIWYHNTENENSGKNAENLNVKIALPDVKTTNHVATATVGGTNTNTLTTIANVNTSTVTGISVIPGSVYRRHNIGTNAAPNWVTEKISDTVYGNGYVIASMKPCWNFQETITVQARVTSSQASLNKQVRLAGTTTWNKSLAAKPGDRIQYLLTFKNEGSENITNVNVRDSLPQGILYVPGTTYLKSTLYPNGLKLIDGIVANGLNVQGYAPNSTAYVYFDAMVPASYEPCGDRSFTNTGYMKSDQTTELSSTAITTVSFPCIVVKHSITALKYEDVNGDGDRDANESPVSNWQITLTGNGENKSQNTASDGKTTFSNLSNGTYTVTEATRSGWRNITPTSRTVTINNADTSVEFGNQQIIVETTHDITALKYEDLDADKVMDANEKALSGWKITLTGNGLNQTKSTDSKGIVKFTNLSNGSYVVTEESRDGWKSITGLTVNVNLNGADASVEFGNQRVAGPTPTPTPTPSPTPNPTPTPSPTPVPYIPEGKGNMPASGPMEAAAGAAGLTATGGAAWSWLKSKKALGSSLKKIK